MVMMPRLQAEEQLNAIYAGRVAQGGADEEGRASIAAYEGQVERQREGLPALEKKAPRPAERGEVAKALGMDVTASGRTFNPLRGADS